MEFLVKLLLNVKEYAAVYLNLLKSITILSKTKGYDGDHFQIKENLNKNLFNKFGLKASIAADL